MRGERENVSTTAGKTKATILCTRPAVPGLVIVRAVTVGAGVMVASLVMMPVPRSRPGTRPTWETVRLTHRYKLLSSSLTCASF